jgi:hypothetical protein
MTEFEEHGRPGKPLGDEVFIAEELLKRDLKKPEPRDN